MPDGAEGQPGGSVSVEEKTSNLWSLLPSFDPSVDSAKELCGQGEVSMGHMPCEGQKYVGTKVGFAVQRDCMESGESH